MLKAKSRSKLILMGGVLVALGVLGGGARVARADGPLAQPAHMNDGDLIIDLGTWCPEGCYGDEESDGFDVFGPEGAYKGTLRLTGADNSQQLAFEYSGTILSGGGFGLVTRYGHSGGSGAIVVPFDEVNNPSLYAFALDVPENIYAAVQVDGGQVVWKFLRDGTGYGTPVEVPAAPVGEGVFQTGIGLYGCTLAYGGSGQVKRYDICTQSQLSDYPTAPSGPVDTMRVLLDGSILTWDEGLVSRIETDGTETLFGDENTCYRFADASVDGSGDILYAVDVCNARIDAYDLDTGSLIGTVKQYSQGELDARRSYPVGVRVYDRVAPPKPVIFVHGVKEDADDAGFAGLQTAFGPNPAPPAPPLFDRARYYQDKAEDCPETSPAIDAESSIDGAFWSGSGYFDDCDSQGDIGKSSVKLHALVQERYEQSGGQRVILIGYSQGVSTIRGMLAYSQELGDGVGSSMVDSAFFIEGVHHGSLMANGVLAVHAASGTNLIPYDPFNVSGSIRREVFDWVVANTFQFEFGRPSVNQLAVNSDWFSWAASPDRELPEIGYYNAYGDIKITDKNCINLVVWGDCYTADLVSFGDGVVQTGSTDDPYYTDIPQWAGGGARFSRPNTTEQWQWALRRESDVKKWKAAIPVAGPAHEGYRLVNFVTGAPELHTNIGANLDETAILDCVTGESTNLEAQIVSIVNGKRGVEDYACPLHD